MAGKWMKPSTPRAKGIGHKGINMNINDLLDAKHEQEQNEEKEVQQVNEEQVQEDEQNGEAEHKEE